MDMWAENSVKNDEICSLAIPNQIFTISMYKTNLMIIHRHLPETKIRTDDRLIDGQTDGQTDSRPEIKICQRRGINIEKQLNNEEPDHSRV